MLKSVFKSLLPKNHLRDFFRMQDGSIAPLAAVVMVVVIGAVGFGIDTLAQQNALSELQHVVTLTCDRVAGVQMAQYPTAKSRNDMGNKFAIELIKTTNLDADRTKVTVNTDSGVKIVSVDATTELDASFTRILGFETLSASASKQCPVAGTGTKNPVCKGNVKNFTNLTPQTIVSSLDDYINPNSKKSYLISVYNEDAVKSVKGANGQTISYVPSLKASGIALAGTSFDQINFVPYLVIDSDDVLILQDFNSDGSSPQACTPPTESIYVPNKLPPPDLTPPSCAADWISYYKSMNNYTEQHNSRFRQVFNAGTSQFDPTKITPAMVAAFGKYEWKVTNAATLAKLNISRLDPYGWNRDIWHVQEDAQLVWLLKFYNYYANNDFNSQTGVSANTGGTPNAFTKAYLRGWNLFYIKNESDSFWFKDDQCIYLQSPIVLDLTGQGRIATTGETTAANVMRRHVGQTVSFDMSGNGRAVQTEWVSGNGQGLLVDNRDGKAASDMSGRRLFGDVDGFANGYEKLATFDTSHTGVLKGHDLDGLMVWIDNGNAIVEPGEMKTLAEVGVTEISAVPSFVDGRKGEKFIRSWAVRNGMPIMTEDVWFAQAPVLIGQK